MVRQHPVSLMLNTEIANVVTAMRQNSKWALIPTRYSDNEVGDDPLLDELKLLRRKLFHFPEWSEVPPQDYLKPFLAVIQSGETGGQITAVALSAVARILSEYVIAESAAPQAEVMQGIAACVVICRFEAAEVGATDDDDTVLYKILMVLRAIIRCPGSELLNDANIYQIFNTAYHLGFCQHDPSRPITEMLAQAALDVMSEVVNVIFGRLHSLPASPSTPPATIPADPSLHIAPESLVEASEQSVFSNDSHPAFGVADESEARHAASSENEPLLSMRQSASHSTLENGPSQHGNIGPGVVEGMGNGFSGEPFSGDVREAYGMDGIAEVFGHLIAMVVSGNPASPNPDLPVYALSLINTAISAGSSAFDQHPQLLRMIKEELCPGLLQAALGGQLGLLSGVCQVALSLYVHLGRHLLLHIATILDLAILRLASGRGTHIEQQEAALEGLLDLCNQDGFVQDVFANMDCSIERINLYESICALLSKTAFPVNCPLGSVHLHSLDGLFSILTSISRHAIEGHFFAEEDGEVAQEDLLEIWRALCEHRHPQLNTQPHNGLEVPTAETSSTEVAARGAFVERRAKAKLALAAEHFNRDYKKGFQYLQSIGLLAQDPDPKTVAEFLRHAPGLSKQTIGNLLGEADEFFLSVLNNFTHTFDFRGLSFDAAIRLYLESFRLPGEAQKINRVMESFGSLYHEQCPELFHNADAVYILAYSVIMLNTDLHNNQVKKKMNIDEFIRNLRGINKGESLPPDYLRSLYESISRNEIRITTDASDVHLSPIIWVELDQASRSTRGQLLDIDPMGAQELNKDMFQLMWGPTVAAVSVVLDHADDLNIITQALDGLLLAAKIAKNTQVDEVHDNLIVSLSKFTTLLTPTNAKSAVLFGQDPKANLATICAFQVALEYKDSVRTGWRNIMDCVVRLYRLNLLPPAVFMLEDEDSEAAKQRLPRASSGKRPSTSNFLSRAFSSLITIDDSSGAPPSQREVEATRQTVQVIEKCRLPEIFQESRFMVPDSLHEMVRALQWASGPVYKLAQTGEDSDAAEVCLELMISLALRNRDRITLIWPQLHAHLATIMGNDVAKSANAIVERATVGLLRVCQRLLTYHQAAAPDLMRSLVLILRLHPEVAWALRDKIASEVLVLVKGSAGYIKSEKDWHIVLKIVEMTALDPGLQVVALEAISHIVTDSNMHPSAFKPCFDNIQRLMAQLKDKAEQRALRALELLEHLFSWLVQYGRKQGMGPLLPEEAPAAAADGGSPAASQATSSPSSPTSPAAPQVFTVADMWVLTLREMSKIAIEPSPLLRHNATHILGRSVMASDALDVWGALWVQMLSDILLPTATDLARHSLNRTRGYPEADHSLCLAIKFLTKAILQYLPSLKAEPDFPDLWGRLLQILQDSTKARSEELTEAVPEATKNMLLVMAQQGVLTPSWQDQSGRSLWDFTWHKAKTVSSGLTPQLLTASGLHFEQPPAPEPAPTPEQPRTEDGYPATVMALAQANSQHIMASPRSEPEQRPFGQDPAAIASPSHSQLHSRGDEGSSFSMTHRETDHGQDSRYGSGQHAAHTLPEDHGYVHSDGRTSLEASRDSQQVSQQAAEQVLLPSITEQEPPPQQPPQQQPASSGGIGSWLWGTMAGPAPPTPQPPQPFHETPAQQPPQVPSPTPLNETSAPQQPFQDSTQHQEHHAVQDPQQGHDMPHDAGPSSPAYRLHRDLSNAQESSMYDTASSQDVDSAARHVALQQAFANHQAQEPEQSQLSMPHLHASGTEQDASSLAGPSGAALQEALAPHDHPSDQGQQGEHEASQPGQHLQETLAGTAYQQGPVDSAGELQRHDPLRLSRPQQQVEHTQDEAHTQAGTHSSSVNPAAQSLSALGPSSSYSSSHDGTFYRQGGASFEESRARLFGPGLQSVFQSAVGVSEDEVSGSRAGLRSMGTAVPLSELQDPGSLDPLATALARASGGRPIDQAGKRGSNTSIASLAGSTASSLLPHPAGPHLALQSSATGGSSFTARSSYNDTPSSPTSGVPTSAAQMSHPYGSPGNSGRGQLQYAGAREGFSSGPQTSFQGAGVQDGAVGSVLPSLAEASSQEPGLKREAEGGSTSEIQPAAGSPHHQQPAHQPAGPAPTNQEVQPGQAQRILQQGEEYTAQEQAQQAGSTCKQA